MGLLSGKKALIFGVANERSIAWGIAQQFKEQGAEVALSYVNDSIKKRVEPLAQKLGASFIFEMDVTNDKHYQDLADKVSQHWTEVDIVVHSIAFADRSDLKDSFVKTSREGFKLACDVSAFSLVGISQALNHMIPQGGSIMAMSYYGSQKVITNYNVMGVAKAALEASMRYLANDLGQKDIKVNCISAGPIKTLAASGISGFRELLNKVEEIAPLKKNVTPQDVGGTACYLASDLSSGVTGQVIYVDSGLSILGGF
ncbi:MAG: enoyl-ACP reductase [Bacteriovoracaceae bacterium]|jgi:enoyl-[acyl-carrier protein] reductase I|nr:enoyl-[acyl-carrier-protein] reductase FabI [Halobacteriovoraceae bacterium]MDP7319001.1 enoyl-ACP reductase [Bacteriovoracaceae bacterium]